MNAPKITTWVVSDWHFNHTNIIKYCDRPFVNITNMTETIIRKHNEVVKPNDIVFMLGDVGMGGGAGSLEHLVGLMNGTKILIRGNHDKLSVTKYLQMGFTLVLESANVKVGKTLVHLRHVPTRSPVGFLVVAKRIIVRMAKRRRSPREIFLQVRREWRQFNRTKGRPVICGHVHNNWAVKGENINVSVEQTDYYPVKLHDVVTRYLSTIKDKT